MTEKTYVAIFVPPAVRKDLKMRALKNGRTMIAELTDLLK